MKTTRRILITLMAAVAVAFAIPGGAMATHGNCDPSPDPYNIQQQTKANGEVLIWVAYGWDGVSVYPDCHGPLVGARVQNTSLTTTWYAHLEGRKGQPVTVAILPNATKTYSAAQLSSVGLNTVDDISGLTLTTSP
jgi:hypothetical protein